MKTMKYLNMTALVLLGIMIVGCSNDDDKVETQPEETNNVVILKTYFHLFLSQITEQLEQKAKLRCY